MAFYAIAGGHSFYLVTGMSLDFNLALRPDEIAAYLNPQYGADKRLLERQDKASTLLHSYDNALDRPPKDPGTYTQRKLGTCLDFLLGFSIFPISAK